jgi:C4-dicarboxylate transporter DctM subunit
MLIIIENSAMATFLSVVLTYTRAPQEIIIFFTDFGVIPMMFWLMLAVICLILGTFIEIIPLFYLTVPIFAAIAISVHVDLLHLFVVFTGFGRNRHVDSSSVRGCIHNCWSSQPES